MKGNILLTGKPGVGKTTAIQRIVDKLVMKDVAGFYSREIREGGRRVGFSIETLSGKSGVLAHVNIRDGPRVSKYGVNIKDIDSIIVPELVAARESGRIIVIDEIAKMELFSDNFSKEVLRCLETQQVLGTIQDRRISFLNQIRTRQDVTLIELTVDNRDRIPFEILELVE